VFGADNPYGRQVREDDFSSLDREKLSSFHRRFYSPSNMAIIISGIIPSGIASHLDHYFGNIRPQDFERLEERQAFTGSLRKKVHISRKGNLQTAIRIGSATINKRNPDYPALKILDTVLGGYFGSRLMKNIREDKGYTYGIRSSVSSLDLSGYKIISTDVGSENTLNALNEIYSEIGRLQNEFVEENELEVVRNYMAGEMLRMFDGPFSTAESFRSAWEFGLDLSYYNKFAEKIRSISPDEIKELANKYYKIEELYQVTAGSE
jgi:predicted Zn-dependent peptidase